MSRLELIGWGVVGFLLCALAIPWFLWGTATTISGLPIWLWWHIGWMVLASVVFWLFGKWAWGIGIEDGYSSDGSSTAGPNPERGER